MAIRKGLISRLLPFADAHYFGSAGRGRLGGGPGQGGYFEPAGMVMILLCPWWDSG